MGAGYITSTRRGGTREIGSTGSTRGTGSRAGRVGASTLGSTGRGCGTASGRTDSTRETAIPESGLAARATDAAYKAALTIVSTRASSRAASSTASADIGSGDKLISLIS